MEVYSLANLYKLVLEKPDKLYWYGGSLSVDTILQRGKCTIHGDILVLGHGRDHIRLTDRDLILKQTQSFYKELETLPRWTQTKYFCHLSNLNLCEKR